MQARTRWVAVGMGVAAIVALVLHGVPERLPTPRVADEAQATHADALRLPDGISIVGKLQPIALDAARAREAMRDGVLRVASPDGTTYRVRMERQEADGFGQWTVFGRVDTVAGPQAAVLTFGGGAVFGTLPMPSGASLSIVTQHDVVLASLAGGLAPFGRTPGNDVATRSRESMQAVRNAAMRNASVRGGTTRDTTQTRTPTATVASAPSLIASSAPPVPTQVLTPSGGTQALAGAVTINVLAVYGDDLVQLRGSEAAVQTELSNKVAAATQAHIDSGSIVRFKLVGTRKLAIPTWMQNAEVLYAVTEGPFGGADTELLRDQLSADFVVVVRAQAADRLDCGTAYVGGRGLYGTDTSALFAYAVINTEPCGPHVLAHEFGHLLGAGHDRDTDYFSGEYVQASYAFARGHRVPGKFATIMAYPDDEPWLGVFSNPGVTACAGLQCGVRDRAEDVRAFNLMARSVADFRTAPGKASISDTGAWEYGWLNFLVRLDGALPDIQPRFGLEVDYGDGWQAKGEVLFYDNPRETLVQFEPHADGIKGGDRRLRVRITSKDGYPVAKNIATGTRYDADPRPKVTYRIFAPDGSLANPGWAFVYGAQGRRTAYDRLYSASGEFYVVPGANVQISADDDTTMHYVARPSILNEVRSDTSVDIIMQRGIPVAGTSPGINLYYRTTLDDWVLAERPVYWANTHPVYVYPGASVQLYDYQGNGRSSRYVLQDVRQPTTLAIPSTQLPRVAVQSVDTVREGAAGRRTRVPVVIEVVQPTVVFDPVKVVYRTLDGTAKRDTDYVAKAGTVWLSRDQPSKTVFVEVIGDGQNEPDEGFYVTLDPVEGAFTSAPKWRIKIRNDDLKTGGPQPKSARQ